MRDEIRDALANDGDRYHASNHDGIGTIADPVFEALEEIHRVTRISAVLEIGCTTGFRLDKCRRRFQANCAGLDVSSAAITEGRSLYPELRLELGAAPRGLQAWDAHTFDAVVLGHFLHLFPREDLFELAAQVDRVLRPGGHIVVMDFLFPYESRLDYHHHAALGLYKGNPTRPWLWHPSYALVGRRVYELAEDPPEAQDPRSWQTVDVIRKLSIDESYPEANGLPSRHAKDD